MRAMTERQLIRGSTIFAAIIPFVTIGSWRASAGASGAGLSCPQGLIVRLYTPRPPKAMPLQMPNGVTVGASGALLKITPPMVEEARVLGRPVIFAGDRKRYRVPEAVYDVTLKLSSEGRSRIQKVVSKDSTQLLVVCNHVVMPAFTIGTPPEAIDVLLDVEHSPQAAAEQFAYSFTQNVHSTRPTPSATKTGSPP